MLMEKKYYFYCLLLFLCIPFAAFSQDVVTTYYTETFSNGFANGMTRTCHDGLTVSSDVSSVSASFRSATYGWVYYNRTNSNLCAATPSKFEGGGVSDDWLSTPAITLPDADNLFFLWEGCSYSSDEPDGYRILVSTTGPNKDDFTDNPIAVITAESTSWTTRYASLDAYRGQTVYIAIHSNTSGFILLIDNLQVATLADNASTGSITVEDMTETMLSESVNNLVLEGIISPSTTSAIVSAQIEVEYDGGTYEGPITSFSRLSDGTHSFSTQVPVEIPSGGCLSYSYVVTVNGYSSAARSGEVYNPGPSIYERRVVIEERTGTWCGYCVRGLAAIDASKEAYPDNYIGIAVHNQDVMTNSYYDSAIAEFCDAGYPAGVCNRVTRISPFPDTFLSAIADALEKRVYAGINVRAQWTDDTETAIDVNVYTNFIFSATKANYNVALVILEQDVYQPGDANYNQTNYYSGGSLGTMGGYEKYGNPITSDQIHYPDVARGIYPEIRGEQAYTEFKAYTPALYQNTLTLPSTVLDKSNVEVVALLIDPATDEILNAAVVSEADFGNMDDPGLSVADAPEQDKAKAWASGGIVFVDLANVEGIASIAVYGLDGTCHVHCKLQGGAVHELGNLPSGIIIVSVAGKNGIETFKLVNR